MHRTILPDCKSLNYVTVNPSKSVICEINNSSKSHAHKDDFGQQPNSEYFETIANENQQENQDVKQVYVCRARVSFSTCADYPSLQLAKHQHEPDTNIFHSLHNLQTYIHLCRPPVRQILLMVHGLWLQGFLTMMQRTGWKIRELGGMIEKKHTAIHLIQVIMLI